MCFFATFLKAWFLQFFISANEMSSELRERQQICTTKELKLFQ